jgi:hypothetical protein
MILPTDGLLVAILDITGGLTSSSPIHIHPLGLTPILLRVDIIRTNLEQVVFIGWLMPFALLELTQGEEALVTL